MKTKILITLITLLALISFSFKNNKQAYHSPLKNFGAAASFDAGYTGAAFDNGGSNCSACHGGGSFAPTITLKVLNSFSNEVTSYIAGQNYNVQVSIVATTGSPKFGFQVMSVNASDNSNLNTWGTTLQLGTKNTLTTGGRNYIEQNSRLPNGIINIPWTAPTGAIGDVTFYAVGNAVDGGGSSGGDNAVSTSLNITAAPVPITLLSFTGKAENDIIKIEWQTAQEINNAYFNIEHSIDGVNFKTLKNIVSKGNTSIGHTYDFADKKAINGANFYRLKQVDVDGKFAFSNIVLVKNNAKTVAIFSNVVTNEILLTNVNTEGTSNYKIVDVTGKIAAKNTIKSNSINVSGLANGSYFLNITNRDNSTTSLKFVKQ